LSLVAIAIAGLNTIES